MIAGFFAPYLVSLLLLIRSRRSTGLPWSHAIFGLGRRSPVDAGVSGVRGRGGKTEELDEVRTGLVEQGFDGVEMGRFEGDDSKYAEPQRRERF